MQWSKTRKLFDARLADSLAGRLEIHVTRYGWTHDEDGRAWVTFDGQEVVNFCFWTFHNRYYQLAEEIRKISGTERYRDLPRQDVDTAGSEAREILHQQGIFSEDEFLDALRDYLQLSVDDTLQSGNPLVRALAMLDRRLGKRRLQLLRLQGGVEHPVVRQFLGLRLQAEGMESDTVFSVVTPSTESTTS